MVALKGEGLISFMSGSNETFHQMVRIITCNDEQKKQSLPPSLR